MFCFWSLFIISFFFSPPPLVKRSALADVTHFGVYPLSWTRRSKYQSLPPALAVLLSHAREGKKKKKTYYGRHYLFKTQLCSLSLQWISNGAAASNSESPHKLQRRRPHNLLRVFVVAYKLLCDAMCDDGDRYHWPCSSWLAKLLAVVLSDTSLFAGKYTLNI